MAIDTETLVSRRSFCNGLLLTSAGVALATSQASDNRTQAQSLLAYPPRKIEGAERVLPGSFLYFEYPKPKDPAVLVRTVDGHYLAFSRKCAHLGCSIDYDKAERCLKCPCHRGVYDARTGYVVMGPPPRPLDQIILQMRAGGEIWAVGKAFGGNLNAQDAKKKNSWRHEP
jgi:Rieske Fe-S protein